MPERRAFNVEVWSRTGGRGGSSRPAPAAGRTAIGRARRHVTRVVSIRRLCGGIFKLAAGVPAFAPHGLRRPLHRLIGL
ncbi:unnamed protein product [Pieris macdunnoughi]|uniref:Uncharacterized protein n=1 Tax=Pieris macdunnoughi TaxID=345717 RepID=A0A821MKQ5_9NEOP|nr:unnamed protein product [Pieris macdunnoughi]